MPCRVRPDTIRQLVPKHCVGDDDDDDDDDDGDETKLQQITHFSRFFLKGVGRWLRSLFFLQGTGDSHTQLFFWGGMERWPPPVLLSGKGNRDIRSKKGKQSSGMASSLLTFLPLRDGEMAMYIFILL